MLTIVKISKLVLQYLIVDISLYLCLVLVFCLLQLLFSIIMMVYLLFVTVSSYQVMYCICTDIDDYNRQLLKLMISLSLLALLQALL